VKSFIQKFKDSTGTVAIEFSAIVTILVILTFPTIDFARYILMQEKVIKSAHMLADAVSMSREITAATTQAEIDQDGSYLTLQVLQQLMNQINILMVPFADEGAGGVDRYQAVVTHIYNDTGNGGPALGWQFDQNSMSLYDGARQSVVGVVATANDRGNPAVLPPSLAGSLNPTENLIAVEFSALYEPITPGMQGIGVPFLASQTVRHVSYFPARYGNLGCIWQEYMPPNDC